MAELKYTLNLEDFKMSLENIRLNDLLPHEEIIPELLERLGSEIEKDGIIKNPVIVDENSLVVLDGNHRVEAVKKLGYDLIPVCVVDYANPLIEVKCWYRTIEGGDYVALRRAAESFNPMNTDPQRINDIVNSTNVLAVVMRDRTLLSEPHKSLRATYETLKHLETALRCSGFGIGYSSEESATKSVLHDSALAYVAMPPPTKEVVVEVARSGRRLPCKTSRHIFPARPMGVDFPLRFLKNSSVDEANSELYLRLCGRQVNQMPPRSIFEGRLYYETLFIFQ